MCRFSVVPVGRPACAPSRDRQTWQGVPRASCAETRRPFSLRRKRAVPLTSREFPSANPSFWGPAWGPIAPFSPLTHRHQKAGSPDNSWTSGQCPARDSNPEPTD